MVRPVFRRCLADGRRPATGRCAGLIEFRSAALAIALGLAASAGAAIAGASGAGDPSVAPPTAPAELALAAGGKALLPIVLVADALPAERTAAAELADYLERVTGATFELVEEGSAAAPAAPAGIHVGCTQLARRIGIDPAALGDEEWVVQTAEGSLILAGGWPRGTLYAVYRFLEDTLGVRWWTPFEESVPAASELTIPSQAARGRPVFAYRDVAGIDGPRAFCARNRVNGHAARLTWAYGGTIDYGPPRQVHNLFLYVPPEEYFDSNPEYFSEIGGVRLGAGAQLCLTQPELPGIVAETLLDYIRASRHAAAIRGVPPPRLFALSHNDWGKACTCEACSAAQQAEGGHPSGPLIAFVNRVAEIVAGSYPDVMLDTLAYSFTFEPPTRIVARDNVVVRVAALYGRNFARGILHHDNRPYLAALGGWRRASPHLRIWDYRVIFGPDGDLPLPNLGSLGDDLRTYREHGVDGLFVQHAHPIAGDLRDLKLWVLLKLLEDPARDPAALQQEFTDGYYGAAGGTIRRYVAYLERRAAASDARIEFSSDHEAFTYIDAAFARHAHGLFDRAERRVKDDPILLRRVRHARLSLDRATLLRRLPGIERVRVAQRYKSTAYEQIDMRADPGTREALKDTVDAEAARYLLD